MRYTSANNCGRLASTRTRFITIVLWAKGDLNPCLTRQNAGPPAVSLRLGPVQSRSLPAVSFSGLDGVKRGHLPARDSAGWSERRDIFDADEHAVAGAVTDEAGACLVGGDRPIPAVVGLPVGHGGGRVADVKIP